MYLSNDPRGKGILDKTPDIPGLKAAIIVRDSSVHHGHYRWYSIDVAVTGYIVLP